MSAVKGGTKSRWSVKVVDSEVIDVGICSNNPKGRVLRACPWVNVRG